MVRKITTKFRFNRALFHGANGRSFEAILTVLKEQQNKINELVDVVNKQQEIINRQKQKSEEV